MSERTYCHECGDACGYTVVQGRDGEPEQVQCRTCDEFRLLHKEFEDVCSQRDAARAAAARAMHDYETANQALAAMTATAADYKAQACRPDDCKHKAERDAQIKGNMDNADKIATLITERDALMMEAAETRITIAKHESNARFMEGLLSECLAWLQAFKTSEAEISVTGNTLSLNDLIRSVSCASERETLIARCESCPNIIEAGTKLEQALVEVDALKAKVEKRDKVIEVLRCGKCPPRADVPACIDNCQTCKSNWITEQLK